MKVVSDALAVVNCVNKNTVVVSIQPIVSDCWKLLQKIPFVMVKHVSKELNSEAHNLASLAKVVGTSFWLRLLSLLFDGSVLQLVLKKN